MDVLRFILLAPFYIVKIVFKFAYMLFKVLFFVLKPIIGKIQWQTPFWVPFVKKVFIKFDSIITKHIIKIWVIVLLICTSLFAYKYYEAWKNNQPKPIEVAPVEYVNISGKIYSPINRNYDTNDTTRYYTLIHFSDTATPVEYSKNITEGINITPKIEGIWEWVNDRELKFTPDKMWDIGQTYTIDIEADKVLSNITILGNNQYSFTTRDFGYFIASSELYQNPLNPSEKNVIYEIRFTDPVDAATFEKNIKVKLVPIVPKDTPSKDIEAAKKKAEQIAKYYNFVVKYDEKKLTAWVRSDFVALPDKDSNMILSISQGVKSSLGGNSTKTKLEKSQYVASSYRDVINNTFLTVAEKQESDELEQILVVNLVDGVNVKDFAKEVKAWVLPKDKPEINNNSAVKNYYWSNSDEISYNILSKSKPLTLTLDNVESDIQKTISFKYSANPQEFVYIEIGKNIKTVGGYKAKYKVNRVLRVPDYPKKLNFVSEGSIVSLRGDKKIPFLVRNINGIEIEVKRVIPSQIQHLVTMNGNYKFKNMNFSYTNENHFIERFTIHKEINANNPGKYVYDGIDISKYLIDKNGGKQGIFLVTLSSWNPKTKEVESYGFGGSKLVVVTDLGIISKVSQDGSSDVFVQSVHSGKPTSNAKVSVLGMNGISVTSQVTDSSGHAHFKNLNNFKNEKQPVVYIVEKDGDMSFLPVPNYGYERSLDFSRFNVSGTYNVIKDGKLDAYLFSDRGLYRPGDNVNIGIIARAENWNIKVAGIPVVARVYDPRGQLVKEVPYTLDESGFNEISFTTTQNSPTGNWQIYLNLAKNYEDRKNENYQGITLGSTFVSVREFEPDRMSVEIELKPKGILGWVNPNSLNATVIAKNLFGTPAQERRVATKLILAPMAFTFNKYKEYKFYDARFAKNRFEYFLEDTKTDNEGGAQLSLLLSEHERASYKMTILSDVFEAGAGRSVGAISEVIVSPNEYLVGAKSDGDMGYIKKDSDRNLHIIAINPELDNVKLEKLKLDIVEQKYISVLTLQASGVYKYQSKLKEILLSSNDLNISKNGVHYKIDTNKPGVFQIVIKNELNDILYKTNYHVVGNANVERSLERNSELELKISKASYKNDEEIEISIDTPYTGNGLITIEKDRVYAWKWFNTNTTSSTQSIRVPKDLKGNGYINIQFVRDINSDEIFMSPLSYGVIPFKVENTKESTHVELNSSKLVKPGEDIQMTIKTDTKQKVVVFAVDEGILQVANYQLTNPLSYFFKKRELAVSSYQILDLILPEFSKVMKLTSAAGGDNEASDSTDSSQHLNPFKRKVDKPVVFWSGITEIDKEKTFNYTIPDYFNGKLRVMAVAVSSDKIGIAQTSTIVKDDFVLTPNVPFMLAPNDEFEVTLGVSNNLENLSKDSIPIEISLITTEHVRIVGNQTQTIKLAEKKEGSVKFNLIATEKLGNAELIFRATYEDKSVKKDYKTQRISTTSIRPLVPFRVNNIMSRIEKDVKSVEELRDMYEDYASREVRIAHSPFVISKGLSNYLSNYPHLCSEQIVSATIPSMINDKYEQEISVASKRNMSYDRLFTILKSRQNSSGSIGLWRVTSYNDYFTSVYTAHFLLEAKENGISIPNSLMKDLNNFLNSFANDVHENSLYSLRLRAYATYLLTRQNIVTTNMLSSIQKSLEERYPSSWKDDVVAIYLASTYKMLKMDKEADALLEKPLNELKKAYSNAWWSNDYYDPLVVNSSYIYFISKHFPEKAKYIPAQALENMMLMIRAEKYTTTSSAMSILAIDSYTEVLSKDTNQSEGNLSIDIYTSRINRSVNKKETLKTSTLSDKESITGNFTKDDVKIVFNNPTKIPAWYAVTQDGYDKNAPIEPIRKGLEIYREYTDENGNPISNTTLGKTINVIVKIRSNSAEGVGSIAVVDLLPGGFEVVYQDKNKKVNLGDMNDNEYSNIYYLSPIDLGDSTWKIDYNDVREDRIMLYGYVGKNIETFKYQIKSTNAGKYQIAPVYAEAMYDREIQAVSAGQGSILVLPAE